MELFENWQAAKETLLSGLPERKKAILAPVLENQKQQVMMETANAGTNNAGQIANFQKIVIPMLRRIIPGTIATELVGVQPMSGPVGLVVKVEILVVLCVGLKCCHCVYCVNCVVFKKRGCHFWSSPCHICSGKKLYLKCPSFRTVTIDYLLLGNCFVRDNRKGFGAVFT
jgi:hypothetical protein